MRKKIKDGILFSAVLLLCVLFLLYSKELFSGISAGISICLNTLIPSLFGFMVISKWITDSSLGTILGKPFSPISRFLFRTDPELFPIFLFSLLGGYPVGPRLISEQVKKGIISQKTGQRMLAFCVNCSPAFLISGVSIPLWGSPLPGLIIFSAQAVSCMLIAQITAFGKKIDAPQKKSRQAYEKMSVAFVGAVSGSVRAMAVICGFVLFFCGFFSLFDLIKLPSRAALLLKGFLEVTSGCQMIIENPFWGTLIACMFTSFGGICVHLQNMALMNGSGLKILGCILWRIPHVLFSLLFTYLGILIFNPVSGCFRQEGSLSCKVWSVSPLSSFLLIVLGIMLLLFYEKPDKISS